MIITRKRITEVLYFLFFVLLFCTTASVPFRSILLFGIIIISILINLNKSLSIRRNRGDATRYIILLYAFAVLTNIYSNGNYQSGIVNLMLLIFMYISLDKYCGNINDFKNLIKIVFITTFIGGPIIGIYQMATGDFLFPVPASENSSYVDYKIFNAQQSNVNYGALTMQVSFFTALILSNSSDKYKLLYYISAIISVICILLTFSRGAIAATAVALLVIILYKKKTTVKSWIRIFWVLLLGTFLLSVYYENIMQFIYSNDVQHLFSQKETSSINDRTQQWEAATEAFLDGSIFQVVFGYGTEYATVLASYSGIPMSAHNIFFGQLTENGLVGFVLMFVVFFNGIKKIIKLNKHSKLALGMCCFMIAIWLTYQLISMIRWEFLVTIILFDIYYRIENNNLIIKPNSIKGRKVKAKERYNFN
ncbi:hypothetical protein AV656_08275 [Bhargavaea cecembensis]|uniref:O-antigen ligase-related domain-containing protein n=1 Tax=Bhargavaea cecembensis TaxID=394098 RepID=A0A163FL17_9BACL|nr:O-antigen ligase family protein [Bhargavaea cecembensis]KZE38886.1 hypothetical protein AV656_08275 [Bhargavaea cecembensis]